MIFLVKKYKPDYSIMCMPHNFDENYLPHVLNKSSQISQKNIDCIAKMNYIVDSFEYNVELPNRIVPIDGCAEQFYILRKKIYVNTINDIVLDIIEWLK